MASFAPTTIAVRDGRCARVRPLRPADAPLVQQFVRELSPQSRYNRFFGPVKELSPSQLARMTRLDSPGERGLVALAGADSPRIVGIAQYAACERQSVELALVIADDWQRQGLGAQLVALLLPHAPGFVRVEGLVLAANGAMLALAAKLGFALEEDAEPGLVRIEKQLGRPLARAA